MPPLIALARDQLRDLAAVKAVAGALAEISIKDIRTLKEHFERSRDFFEDIRKLYITVRSAAEFSDADGTTFGRENSPAITVALTSNHRFYGTLNQQVMRSFLDGLWQSGGEGLVIGRTGRTLLAQTPYDGRVPTLIFNEDAPSEDESRLLLHRLSSYGRIYIYYPQFVTMLTQRITHLDIAAEAETALRDTKVAQQGVPAYFFEPEIEKLAQFFETAVRRFMFSRVFF